jgi:hypothetical protein
VQHDDNQPGQQEQLLCLLRIGQMVSNQLGVSPRTSTAELSQKPVKMPKMLATAFCASEAAHTAATSWLILVVVMIIGMDARTAAAGTKPVSTSPSAMDPARNRHTDQSRVNRGLTWRGGL